MLNFRPYLSLPWICIFLWQAQGPDMYDLRYISVLPPSLSQTRMHLRMRAQQIAQASQWTATHSKHQKIASCTILHSNEVRDFSTTHSLGTPKESFKSLVILIYLQLSESLTYDVTCVLRYCIQIGETILTGSLLEMVCFKACFFFAVKNDTCSIKCLTF